MDTRTDPALDAADRIIALCRSDASDAEMGAGLEEILAAAERAGVRGTSTPSGLDPTEQSGVAAVLARSGYPAVTG